MFNVVIPKLSGYNLTRIIHSESPNKILFARVMAPYLESGIRFCGCNVFSSQLIFIELSGYCGEGGGGGGGS